MATVAQNGQSLSRLNWLGVNRIRKKKVVPGRRSMMMRFGVVLLGAGIMLAAPATAQRIINMAPNKFRRDIASMSASASSATASMATA